MPETPEYTSFVSSVEGRVVPRWDTPGLFFGARIVQGDPPVVWDTKRVVPLTQAFCDRYSRELSQAFEMGDLVERTREDFEAYEAARLEAREKRKAEREAAAAAAKAAEEASASSDAAHSDSSSSPTTGSDDTASNADSAASAGKGKKK